MIMSWHYCRVSVFMLNSVISKPQYYDESLLSMKLDVLDSGMIEECPWGSEITRTVLKR